MINLSLTRGVVLLSSCTTRAGALCSQRDDGTTKHHHTSVSCSSSKVFQIIIIQPHALNLLNVVQVPNILLFAKNYILFNNRYNHVFIGRNETTFNADEPEDVYNPWSTLYSGKLGH